jgi:FkbM family methyltransferase
VSRSVGRRLLDVAMGALGYDLVVRKRNHATLHNHLERLFEHLRVNCVIDVGANTGQFGGRLRERGFRGRIASFEPLAANFAGLRSRCARDRDWRAYHAALGEAAGQRKIHVTRGSDLASFHVPTDYALRQFRDGAAEVESAESVEVRTLDGVFAEIVEGLEDPRVFLKLDTQGHDLEVVAGGGASLPRLVGLQSEISMLPVYEDIPDYLTALATYRRLGFEVTGLYPVSRDRETLAVIEFDCVMRRREAGGDA